MTQPDLSIERASSGRLRLPPAAAHVKRQATQPDDRCSPSMAKEIDPWIQASDVIPMFPTLVWKILLKPELRDAIDEKAMATLESLRRDLPILETGQGWQSEQTLHEREEFQDLISCATKLATSILRFLRVGLDAFEITGCWATVLAKGATHKVHSHPNNFLSGVYYVRIPPGSDTINFHDPRYQSRVIRPPVVELTAENTDQIVVRVTSGTLLMFPSYLEHSVDANASGEERISISFNIMFTSLTEQLSKPLW
jgi:uncharacterized protein (TIGR02466 family)